jgi:hypothetical protein
MHNRSNNALSSSTARWPLSRPNWTLYRSPETSWQHAAKGLSARIQPDHHYFHSCSTIDKLAYC